MSVPCLSIVAHGTDMKTTEPPRRISGCSHPTPYPGDEANRFRTIPTGVTSLPRALVQARRHRRDRPQAWRICHPDGPQTRVLTNFCVKRMQASVMLFGLPDATHEVGTRLMRAVSAQRATVSPFT